MKDSELMVELRKRAGTARDKLLQCEQSGAARDAKTQITPARQYFNEVCTNRTMNDHQRTMAAKHGCEYLSGRVNRAAVQGDEVFSQRLKTILDGVVGVTARAIAQDGREKDGKVESGACNGASEGVGKATEVPG